MAYLHVGGVAGYQEDNGSDIRPRLSVGDPKARSSQQ